MKEIMMVSTNAHKIEEFKQMLEPLGFVVKSLLDADEKFDIVEDGTTFQENAAIKADFIRNQCNIMAIADDSGLEIDALNKEPGIHSARYLGHDTDYTYKNTVILERMKGVTNRSARFVSAIALAIPNQETKIFTGVFEGEIHTCIAGGNGFGYDPIFYVPECGCTSAELSPEAKNAISHRGKALEQVLAYLKEAGL